MGDHQLSSEDEDDESVISLWERQPTFDQESSDDDGCEKKALTSTRAPCRSTSQPTIYQKLTKANVDWCRYCGTTEGVNWRPGPWGKRTLCK
ncbi:hypothetical protein CLU79DRAFT_743989 [Phycomyces nitens]|nr:hypothetical protein CLU79DRAFT_743989 [Phycomyces nitens]